MDARRLDIGGKRPSIPLYSAIFIIIRSQLRLNDTSKTVVAQYHRPKNLALFSKAPKPSLEVTPGFEHMLDEILVWSRAACSNPLFTLVQVTFVYIEQLRKSRDGTQAIIQLTGS